MEESTAPINFDVKRLLSHGDSQVIFGNIQNPQVLEWLAKHQDEMEIEIEVTNKHEKSTVHFPPPPVLAKCFEIPKMNHASNHSASASSSTAVHQTNAAINGEYAEEDGEETSPVFFDESDGVEPLKELPKDICGNPVVKGLVKIPKTGGQYITGTADSTEMYRNQDYLALYQRFLAFGYVIVRNIIPRQTVLTAQAKVISSMIQKKNIDPKTQEVIVKEGFVVSREHGNIITGANVYSEDSRSDMTELAQCSEIAAVIRNEEVQSVLDAMAKGKSLYDRLENECYLFDPHFTWLRIKAPKELTPEHADLMYFKMYTDMYKSPKVLGGQALITRATDLFNCALCNTAEADQPLLRCDECFLAYHVTCCIQDEEKRYPSLHSLAHVQGSRLKDEWYCADCCPRPIMGTCWIPLQDIALEDGTLAILPGTMKLPRFDKVPKNRQISESFYNGTSSKGLIWHVSPTYSAGDLVLFDSKVVHGSTKNCTKFYRLSLDFRWFLLPKRENAQTTKMTGYVKKEATPLKRMLLLPGQRKVAACSTTNDEEDEEEGDDEEEEDGQTTTNSSSGVDDSCNNYPREWLITSTYSSSSKSSSLSNKNHDIKKKKKKNSSKKRKEDDGEEDFRRTIKKKN